MNFVQTKDDLPGNSNGTSCARGIFKLASMHPLSEILAENDRREVARLEDNDNNDNKDFAALTPEQLEEKRSIKRR